MALPNQTLELTNSNQMPPVISLTGDEIIPAAENLTTKLPISFTSIKMGDYIFGNYTYRLNEFAGTVTNLSNMLLVDNGQTYTITIGDLSNFISPQITITGSGLATVTTIGNSDKNVDVPKATVEECDAAERDDVAVTPLGLSHYKDRLDELEAELAALLYVPVDITSFTNNYNTLEIGQVVNTTITLTWAINKDVTVQTVNNGSLDPTLRTILVAAVPPISTDKTFTMSATDGQTTDSASTSIVFRNKRYWGVSPNTTLTNSEIIALSSEFSTSKTKDVTYNATGGNYVYYAYPSSFGNLSAVKVGGLSFSDYTTTVINFTNASGYSSSYNLIRINNIQTGSNIQVHWE